MSFWYVLTMSLPAVIVGLSVGVALLLATLKKEKDND